MATTDKKDNEYKPKRRFTMPGVPASDLNDDGKLTPAKRRHHEQTNPAYPGYLGPDRGSKDATQEAPKPVEEAEETPAPDEPKREEKTEGTEPKVVVVVEEGPAAQPAKKEEKAEANKK